MVLLVLHSAPVEMDELEEEEPAAAKQSTGSSDILQLVRNQATLV